ncbi:unnamed protein product [Pedinophyceae sp. YPF-701]|nr:unnamed protein product [Pedinophyceae sp. YPF-701]
MSWPERAADVAWHRVRGKLPPPYSYLPTLGIALKKFHARNVQRVLRRVARVLRVPVALWLCLPYRLRTTLTRVAGWATKRELLAAGFDAEGRSPHPLRDVPRWRFERLVGCGVRDVQLFRRAFTATSALPLGDELRSYERLEYLGDAVMSIVVREWMLEKYPEEKEGTLTMIESKLVSEPALYRCAMRLGLNRFAVVNAHDMRNNLSHYRPKVLADCFEALLGALLTDRGIGACRSFVRRVVEDAWPDTNELMRNTNYKQQLVRMCRDQGFGSPRFRTVRKLPQRGKKPPQVSVEVSAGGTVYGKGTALTPSLAENEAAEVALATLSDSGSSSDEDEGAGRSDPSSPSSGTTDEEYRPI